MGGDVVGLGEGLVRDGRWMNPPKALLGLHFRGGFEIQNS